MLPRGVDELPDADNAIVYCCNQYCCNPGPDQTGNPADFESVRFTGRTPEDLARLVAECMADIRDDYRAPDCGEDDPPSLRLTVATDEEGDAFAFQTGDNSFTGGCYGLPHWAVACLSRDDDPDDVAAGLICELEDGLNP